MEAGSIDVVVCSACMIKGHLPNNCFDTFLYVMKKGGDMVFSIRDIYLSDSTDGGMNYHGALKEREEAGVMKKVE